METERRKDLERRYLDVLKLCLTGQLSDHQLAIVRPVRRGWARLAFALAGRLLARQGYRVVRQVASEARREGRDWPVDAETMVGSQRLDNIEHCVREAVESSVAGDLVECGTWRGGAAIYMRGVLEALGETTRRVWVADSFRGLPKPDLERYPEDSGDVLHFRDQLAIGIDEVRGNFKRYGLLDEQVSFLEGWFEDTLPAAPIGAVAVLRLDADMYKGTAEALDSLYPKVSSGGFVIVDDYGAMPSCRKAVDDFRRHNHIADPLETIDWTGVFWRRSD